MSEDVWQPLVVLGLFVGLPTLLLYVAHVEDYGWNPIRWPW